MTAAAGAPAELHGGCLCGAVGYRVPDAFEYALICHCSLCRRATGAANKPFGGIARAALALTRGAENLLSYGDDPDNRDLRCATCGSLLWSVVRDGAYVHVTYGTLAQPPSLAPTAHIFTGSKAAWEIIADSLPRYREL